ncbi:hypothetical protein CK203_087100 [Vitis vinifera]|uniref:Reverse transcriptase domain-containing protein n=1 Tax=Vitis vinifera TaxID=29760 RepID=A0A438EBB4_VITVI|nr:hypothetical protein CK203_087100 [Vitis vinifera]
MQVHNMQFTILHNQDAANLEELFREKEVFIALSKLNKDKALGSNDFSLAFWQHCWEVVKVEVLSFFKEFHEHGCFVKNLNATFLVLVPKKGGVEELKDFKPINLVDSIYKLLAKVLANRLKKMIGKVVSKYYNVFMGIRQILDAGLKVRGSVILVLICSSYGSAQLPFWNGKRWWPLIWLKSVRKKWGGLGDFPFVIHI